MQHRVRFTATAQRHLRREKAWWVENRIHIEVLAAEFNVRLQPQFIVHLRADGAGGSISTGW